MFVLAQVEWPLREAVLHGAWVVQVAGSTTRSRLVVITDYHLLLVKAGRVVKSSRKLVARYPLLQLSAAAADLSAGQLKLDFVKPGELVLAGVPGAITQALVARYRLLTWGWPADLTVAFDDFAWAAPPLDPPPLPAPSPGGNILTAYRSVAALQGWSAFSPDLDRFLAQIVDGPWARSLLLSEVPNVSSSKKVSLNPLALALKFNRYFDRLELTDVSRPRILGLLAFALASNTTLTQLVVSNCGARTGIDKLTAGLLANPGPASLALLDLSFNPLKDKGVAALAPALDTLPFLTTLNLKATSMTGDGLAALLASRPPDSPLHAITALDISSNRLEATGSSALGAWLAGHRVVRLQSLGLGSTDLHLGLLLQAMGMRVATVMPPAAVLSTLTALDLSGLDMDGDTIVRAVTFLSALSALADLNLSSMRVEPAYLARLVAAFGSASASHDGKCKLALADLDLSAGNAPLFLGSFGSFTSLHTLVLDDLTAPPPVLLLLLNALKPFATSLRTLSLDRVFKTKSRDVPQVVMNLAALMATGAYSEVSLVGAGSRRLGAHGAILLDALATQSFATLRALDVSYNRMGSALVAPLVLLLADNTTLVSLSFDGNGLSLDEFTLVTDALASASALVEAVIPVRDIKVMRAKVGVETKLAIALLVKRIKETLAHNAAAAAAAAATAAAVATSSDASLNELNSSLGTSLAGDGLELPDSQPLRLRTGSRSRTLLLERRASRVRLSIASAASLDDIEAALDDIEAGIGGPAPGHHPRTRSRLASRTFDSSTSSTSSDYSGYSRSAPQPSPTDTPCSDAEPEPNAASADAPSLASAARNRPPPPPVPTTDPRFLPASAPAPVPAPAPPPTTSRRATLVKPPTSSADATRVPAKTKARRSTLVKPPSSAAIAAAGGCGAPPPKPPPPAAALLAALPAVEPDSDSDEPEAEAEFTPTDYPRASVVCSSIERLLSEINVSVDDGGYESDQGDDPLLHLLNAL
ncbi:uncharacterized protein AMSG_05326 [Thecamonas trahens ATCC 50062]|uniref:Uncharacterized protein n=1 Tax=Thecamonas trahens ATCC 50062 TaxID=461836 RepID=A0A0L0DAF5_THETB|nr:hypothetical protein AMSG_05326 [Thecamonas trahens ATCC 50062]KNC49327.1 hypothetical protein AMSG_05326 [Thecamonas trahens ATCC 50062]|eukprot:XP_013758035.1 hypothetical protein AMSG_05326 [Thecamonas trahens ATCC 50062]